jgi:hypothetical protein
MKFMMHAVFAGALLASLPALAQEANGCPEGSYSIVVSPDGTTLSILFDQFILEGRDRTVSWTQRKVCRISSPLNLPENYSIGVYNVDYRGFTKLFAGQETELGVQYFLGPRDNQHGRFFRRKIKGPQEGDFLFTEAVGAGQMKRAGCGAGAMLNVNITLSLDGDMRIGDAMASLDTTDVAPGGALVYHLNLRKCP